MSGADDGLEWHDGRPSSDGEQRRSRKRTKQGVYTSDVTVEDLSRHFHQPASVACQELGMGLTIFKRVCRKLGLDRWPYEKPTRGANSGGQSREAPPAGAPAQAGTLVSSGSGGQAGGSAAAVAQPQFRPQAQGSRPAAAAAAADGSGEGPARGWPQAPASGGPAASWAASGPAGQPAPLQQSLHAPAGASPPPLRLAAADPAALPTGSAGKFLAAAAQVDAAVRHGAGSASKSAAIQRLAEVLVQDSASAQELLAAIAQAIERHQRPPPHQQQQLGALGAAPSPQLSAAWLGGPPVPLLPARLHAPTPLYAASQPLAVLQQQCSLPANLLMQQQQPPVGGLPPVLGPQLLPLGQGPPQGQGEQFGAVVQALRWAMDGPVQPPEQQQQQQQPAAAVAPPPPQPPPPPDRAQQRDGGGDGLAQPHLAPLLLQLLSHHAAGLAAPLPAFQHAQTPAPDTQQRAAEPVGQQAGTAAKPAALATAALNGGGGPPPSAAAGPPATSVAAAHLLPQGPPALVAALGSGALPPAAVALLAAALQHAQGASEPAPAPSPNGGAAAAMPPPQPAQPEEAAAEEQQAALAEHQNGKRDGAATPAEQVEPSGAP